MRGLVLLSNLTLLLWAPGISGLHLEEEGDLFGMREGLFACEFIESVSSLIHCHMTQPNVTTV